MKNLIMSFSLMLLVSCATNHVKQQVVTEQQIIEDTVKEDKIIGDPLPSWTKKSGIENGMVYVVGKAEFGANKSPFYIEKAAAMDAEMKLFSDAPTDIRVIAQNAMTGAGIDSSEFYQIQTKLQEVIGVTGIRLDAEKVICKKIIRYGELSSRLTRACWVQAYIPVKELFKAYRRTLALKFGEYKAGEFKNHMQNELNKINNNPLVRGSYEGKRSNTIDSNVPNGKSSGRNGLQLPAKKTQEIRKESKAPSVDSKRRHIQSSSNRVKKSNASNGLSSKDQSRKNSTVNKQVLQRTSKVVEKLKS